MGDVNGIQYVFNSTVIFPKQHFLYDSAINIYFGIVLILPPFIQRISFWTILPIFKSPRSLMKMDFPMIQTYPSFVLKSNFSMYLFQYGSDIAIISPWNQFLDNSANCPEKLFQYDSAINIYFSMVMTLPSFLHGSNF